MNAKKQLSPETLKVLVTLAIGLRRANRRLVIAEKRLQQSFREKDTLDFYLHDRDVAESNQRSLGYSLYLAKASVGRYNKKIKFEDIPDYGDLMTLQRWKECCDSGCFIDYDGHGDLATFDKCSNFQISPSERNLIQIPDWATHIVWYNR